MKDNHNTPDMSEADTEKLAQFKLDVASDSDVGEEARESANSDMRFVNVPGGMWEDFLEADFDADRVKLELDLVSDFLSSFIGEWNQNRVGVEFKADDSKTTGDDADLMANTGPDLVEWVAKGSIRVAEDIVEGLENAPAGLIGLLAGDNFGKRMVKVS